MLPAASPQLDVAFYATCYSPLPPSCGRGRALSAGEGELTGEEAGGRSRRQVRVPGPTPTPNSCNMQFLIRTFGIVANSMYSFFE